MARTSWNTNNEGDKTIMTSSRTDLPAWQRLAQHVSALKPLHLNQLFAEDGERFKRFSLSLPHMLLDYSKQRINAETRDLLLELAKSVQLEAWRERMFSGEAINITEDRAVLHVALRSKTGVAVDGVDTSTEVSRELARIESFAKRLRGGEWRGYKGDKITDLVCIGIGGSHLGPEMIIEALQSYSDGSLRPHFVSNVDGVQIAQTLDSLNPATTMFVVASKTFTTTETMTNAASALQWFMAAAGDKSQVAKHFVAVTANIPAAEAMGIDADNVYAMWDWVGGRFSLWSAIGLPIALVLGFEHFQSLLKGAADMDEHFRSAPLAENGPVMLGLLSLWNTTFMGFPSQAVLPYDQSLHMLAKYMQQAEMESNGKSVNRAGETVEYPTVPLIWGELGINGQHAFFQFLHQSSAIVPCDFIGSVHSCRPLGEHHDILMANFFAQTRALMTGVSAEAIREDLTAKGMGSDAVEALVPHKVHQGNKPTTSIVLDKISPESVGALIAMYEHKIFVQGVLLDICSYDQWGVELGKIVAKKIQRELTSGEREAEYDSSTENLINHYLKNKSQ